MIIYQTFRTLHFWKLIRVKYFFYRIFQRNEMLFTLILCFCTTKTNKIYAKLIKWIEFLFSNWLEIFSLY